MRGFEKNGFNKSGILTADNADEAIDKIRIHKPTWVITDSLDGEYVPVLEAANKIKAQAIVISAQVPALREDFAKKVESYGASFIDKGSLAGQSSQEGYRKLTEQILTGGSGKEARRE